MVKAIYESPQLTQYSMKKYQNVTQIMKKKKNDAFPTYSTVLDGLAKIIRQKDEMIGIRIGKRKLILFSRQYNLICGKP